MSTIGERLKEERKRLKLNQTVFGEIGGVQRRAQVSYEADASSPTADYLSKIAKAGCDVSYIVIGRRTLEPETRPTVYRAISPRHADMLDLLEALDDDGLACLRALAEMKKQWKEMKEKIERLENQAGVDDPRPKR